MTAVQSYTDKGIIAEGEVMIFTNIALRLMQSVRGWSHFVSLHGLLCNNNAWTRRTIHEACKHG